MASLPERPWGSSGDSASSDGVEILPSFRYHAPSPTDAIGSAEEAVDFMLLGPRILSVDPGKWNTGIAIVDAETERLIYYDVIQTYMNSAAQAAGTNLTICSHLDDLRKRYNVQHVLCERQFKDSSLLRLEGMIGGLATAWVIRNLILDFNFSSAKEMHDALHFKQVGHANNKATSIKIMRGELNHAQPALLEFLETKYSKLDDIADAYLHALVYARKLPDRFHPGV